ncbi:GPO family capsid scaffolding protein [Aliivibrio fischeri]|uniref:GPO family capsid scaffolding protein n=1 Tax=Aliivibrio fischeri TaxID=668 RepID=UPI0007C59BFA|nr:GPO family capsid scaffolding protein [Aliivibrio fischeri]MBP3140125.1 GPO family capsid scaffolding protein [Aliivibrio fischeri]MBP3154507.1 GPO family capsid scaffolding protein [Aliivibrio fischeri]MCE7572249.1 GPO family capsid scaffolding protein [Aliivibrio fischeri]
MSKQSGWKIAATEGATIDGRTITKQWIEDMADQYSMAEYGALIWPEHSRSRWDKFEGKNWGTVDEVKSEKRAGKYRLLVKVTPNKYLLAANADGQKLFMSIEPDPDYCGSGRCYLMGLAVTDSPASTGTTLLKFSKKNGEENSHEYSQLEELDLSDVLNVDHSLIASAFSTIANFFSSGGQLPTIKQQTSEPEEDEEPMNSEQFSQMMGKLEKIEEKQTELESKQTEFSAQVQKISVSPEEETEPTKNDEQEGITPEQFNQLSGKLDTLLTKQSDLENQFNALKKEVPNQEPEGEGVSSAEAI